MWPSDDFCAVLGIPDHLHTSEQTPNQEFEVEERLYRRHKLNDRKVKTIISFQEMSVNRSSCCQSPADALINTRAGGKYSGYGVVSFSVYAVRGLLESKELPNQASIEYSAVVIHEPERCNYSHTIVSGRINGIDIPKDGDLPKISKKLLRKQLWKSITTEIPIDLQGGQLEEDSWL